VYLLNKTLLLAIIVIIIIVVGVGLYLQLAGQAKPAEKKILRVGTSPDFPPFEYVDEQGNIVGFDIDMMRELAKMMGYDDIEIVSIDFEGLIPALQQGQIDVIAAGMTITEEREQQVDFTIPYWEADQAILVVKGGSFQPKSPDDLVGKVVGVQTGTTAESYLTDLVENQGYDITIKSYSSYVLAVTDLVNGRIDAVMVDLPVAKMFEKQYNVQISGIVETGEKYGLAVREGNTELLNKLNDALTQLMQSDKWDQLVQKYFGQG